MRPVMIVGLDIGSSKVSAAAAEFQAGQPASIIAHASFPSKGVSRGAIVDLGEATDAVSKALGKISEKARRRIGDIYVSVSGQTTRGERSRGMIPLSLRGREVTGMDMERVSGVAGTIRLAFDREIIHRLVNAFSIDDQPWIRDPAGLYASRLACEVYVISAGINHLQSIYKCVNDAGHDVKEAVFAGIAEGEALLDDDEKEAGVAVIDMGLSLTNLSIFSGGALRDIEVIPLGSGDISGGLSGSPQLAEITEKVKTRIEDHSKHRDALTSAIVTGGMAFDESIVDILEARLGLPVKVGIVRDLRGSISGIEAMGISTAIGLAKYGHAAMTGRFRYGRNIANRISSKVIDIFNNYF